ncbi:hypothetical protein [Candidatus Poriferisocius sp.]|uniref:hypothetical protein n=1 Tax=Candidatus Poriferisocius sp. TaxID=3101276 RepID=UPI003B01C6A8
MPRTARTHHQPLLTPTGAAATAETLRTGDTVLVWTHANPEAPKRTWGAVAPSNSRWPAPVHRDDFQVAEAVICRFDQQWHTTSARRGITLGTVVSSRPHHGDSTPAWPDGTVDVAVPRADLTDGLTLACIDIEHSAPFNLDTDEWNLTDEQIKRFNDAARLAGRHLATVPWPPSASALPGRPCQYLPEKLVLWRDKGVPLHIRALRRLAKEHGTVPHPDDTAVHDLLHLLRPGDQLDCYTRTGVATGRPAHASGIGAGSFYPAHVAEVDSQWWYSAFNRGAAAGTHLATTDNATVLAAMTDDDFQACIALAQNDNSLQCPGLGNAAAALAALEYQYDDICCLNADANGQFTPIPLTDDDHCAYRQPRAPASSGIGL